MFKEQELTGKIIGIAMKVHREIGPGFQERIYHRAMVIALRANGILCESEKEFSVFFEKKQVGLFRVDIAADHKVIVELKAVMGVMPPLFKTQIISYLKASGLEVGLIMNFGNRSLEVQRLARYQGYQSPAISA